MKWRREQRSLSWERTARVPFLSPPNMLAGHRNLLWHHKGSPIKPPKALRFWSTSSLLDALVNRSRVLKTLDMRNRRVLLPPASSTHIPCLHPVCVDTDTAGSNAELEHHRIKKHIKWVKIITIVKVTTETEMLSKIFVKNSIYCWGGERRDVRERETGSANGRRMRRRGGRGARGTERV